MTIKTWAERLEYIPDGAITTNAHVQSAMLEEIEELRTQLAEIAATEPIARAMSDKTNTGYVYVKVLADKLQFGTNLYSHPMPAQGVNAELVEALEALIESTTGVDQVSVVNDARTALSKYKGANK